MLHTLLSGLLLLLENQIRSFEYYTDGTVICTPARMQPESNWILDAQKYFILIILQLFAVGCYMRFINPMPIAC
jgi:hypothetical protein